MALGIPEAGGGSGHPYLKYDAKAGRWFRRKKDNEQSDPDITNQFMALFDFPTLEIGWAMFATGGPPSYVMVPHGQKFPARPDGKDWKAGFRLTVHLPQALGGGTYEIASSARAFIDKMDELHDQYMAAPESKIGKVPVVRMQGVELIETKSSHGTNRNYAPRLMITGWQMPPASEQKQPAPPSQTNFDQQAVPDYYPSAGQFSEEMDSSDVPF